MFQLKPFWFRPNYGYYGPQQPIATSGEPSCIHDLVMRFGTGVSDSRETRGSSDERWPPESNGALYPAAEGKKNLTRAAVQRVLVVSERLLEVPKEPDRSARARETEFFVFR